MKSIWVYDLETLAGCFTYTGMHVGTKEVVQYVIHPDRDDRNELLDHLNECTGQIGFNNLNFDYPIIHYFMTELFYIYPTTEELIIGLYERAQELINEQNSNNFNSISAIAMKECKIKQLDLFKIWHYNNKARGTSLKALEVAMRLPNVMEMEIDHTRQDISKDEINHILEYNLNDVEATYEFYLRSIDKIKLRRDLKKKYNLPCMNFSDTKIGEQLMLKLYCEATSQSFWDVRKMRTYRTTIALKDCIFDYVNFKSPEFNALLDKFNEKVITSTKNAFKESVIYKGFKYDFGTGGIHGCIKSGVYEEDDQYAIIDVDVASLYPSIAVVNKLYPEHLGEVFCGLYEDILKQRIAAKKAGNMVISDAFKLSLNSVYGKSNDQFSFLMDSLYTIKTTLNGQLLLSMLAESIVDKIDDLTVLQINTDGITVKINRRYINKFMDICKLWEAKTNLILEYVDYSKMVIGDVNNYLAVTTKGKIKHKGRFEIDKDYHKDPSFRIVPIALQEYFVNGVTIEHTIMNHDNIYDFCGRQKFKKGDHGEIHRIENYRKVVEQQQKVTRYYVSTNGNTFIKQYQKGTSEFIHVGYKVTIFNKYEQKATVDYNLDYNFYIRKCKRELEQIEDNQLTLF